MKSSLSRAVTAVGLGASLWFTSIAAVAGQVQTQDQSQGQNQSTTAQKDKKSQSPEQQQPASQPANNMISGVC